MSFTYGQWALIGAFVFILALCAGVKKSPAEEVKVCATITLPEKGKCITRTIHGYKVRVCG